MAYCIEHTQGGTKNIPAMVTRNKKQYAMHRLVYCESNGLEWEDIAGWVIRHKCDNRRCINPDHLEMGTHEDNMKDMVDRNRAAIGERQGRSTVSDKDAQEIHDTYKAGGWSMQQLADRYGVSKFAISYIIKERLSVCRT
ncbi:hypothetical protein [Aeromonas phage 25AhydR2PP]|uniref:HNH nuclease domain-containing protein n=1 Tax=Aeromonas phage 25AhydR2PP TaxID=2163976 RepID=A0A2S1PFT5_9CAUD|nr:endonuclease [Aeromonas phage 25AhydR2PP]AWH15428.1 hypothetical protein [Aeromonas phage 25AhydR2PP]